MNAQIKEEIGREQVTNEVGTVPEEIEAVREVGTVRDKCKQLEQQILYVIREDTTKHVIKKIEVSATSVHGLLKPPTFDGQTSWTAYRRQFEAAAVSNGWDDQQKSTALVLALRGKALEILQNISEAKQGNYSTVVGALELRYGKKYLSQVYQSQQKSRIQGHTETLQEIAADIE